MKTPLPSRFVGRLFAGCLLAISVLSPQAEASDWPRWLGPDGRNLAPGAGFNPDLSQWKAGWKAEVGHGYSSVTVAGDRAFTMGHDGTGSETVFCFDVASGKVKWTHTYSAELLPRMHPGGPNASVSIFGDRVVAVSKDGQVFCLAADTGREIWKADLPSIMAIKVPNWGFASSPVLHDGLILTSAGKVAALDLATGKPAWTSADAIHPGYTTTVVFKRGGDTFIAALGGKELTILSAKDGKEIARHPFKAQFDMVATTPVILDDGQRIFISGNTTSEMLDFDGRALESAWVSSEFRNAMNNSVVLDGVAYGIDGKQGAPARFAAIDLASGRLRWAHEDFGYGTVIAVGDSLLALTENGELVTVKADPTGYREQGRLQVLGKTCWTTPVFARGRIFARNDRGDVVCLVH